MTGNGFDRDIRFEIVKHIGVLSTHSTGWKKELNLVAWNGGKPKYDIREWDIDHEHMTRGITLHEKEAAQLLKSLAGEFIEHKQLNELGIDNELLLGFLGE